MARAIHGEAVAWANAAVHYEGDDCLLWPFATRRGYAAITRNRKTMSVGRYVCILAHGEPFLIWNQAAHNCGNRLCCNPRHLRWTTRVENEADKKAHGTDNRGERHGRSTLTTNDVLAIRRSRNSGAARARLAREYNVKPATIYDITSRRRWAWLKGESA
jgi:hypothetical protein